MHTRNCPLPSKTRPRFFKAWSTRRCLTSQTARCTSSTLLYLQAPEENTTRSSRTLGRQEFAAQPRQICKITSNSILSLGTSFLMARYNQIQRTSLHCNKLNIVTELLFGSPRPRTDYQDFQPGFTEVAEPMRELTRKMGQKQSWTKRRQAAFFKLKKMIGRDLRLSIFDPQFPTILSMFTSDVAIGGSLYHKFNTALKC